MCLALLTPISSAGAATKSLNNKNNQNSCVFIKTKYKTTNMVNWSNGIARDSDMLKEIDENINMLSTRKKFTNGLINTTLKSWILAEENTKKSIENKNIEEITKAMELKITSVTKFNKLCKSVGK